MMNENQKKNEAPTAYLVPRADTQAALMLAARLSLKTLRLIEAIEKESRLRYAHKPSAEEHRLIQRYCDELKAELPMIEEQMMAAVLCKSGVWGMPMPKYIMFGSKECENCPEHESCKASMEIYRDPKYLLSKKGMEIPKGMAVIPYADVIRMEDDIFELLNQIDELMRCVLLFLNDTPYTPRELGKVLKEVETTYNSVYSHMDSAEYSCLG